MLIGAGEQRDGLYYLTRVREEHATVCHVNHSDSTELWHRRLGHPSYQVFRYLPFIKDYHKHLSHKSCDVCFRAKQTRESFSLSLNNAIFAFDLVHCDL